jgi:hypothetical protein
MYNENPFKTFAASKMSNNPRFNVSVEYTDFLGNTHRIVCKPSPSLKSSKLRIQLLIESLVSTLLRWVSSLRSFILKSNRT